MKHNTLITIIGWIVFIIALTVYLLTLEPANSFWDCSEFIACANKLQVSHSPGAPFYMLMARLFALFAGGDNQKVAISVNILSSLTSALTVMFLFYTITNLCQRVFFVSNPYNNKQLYLAMVAGLIGSFAFAFSDSFWFSAVEAEVYAFSSFLTALSFWAILKWEKQGNDTYSYRWLLFIAFIIGISIGVHLLNLLTLPAIVFIIMSKNKKLTNKNVTVTFVVSLFILGFLLNIFIPGIAKFSSKIDFVCVNFFGLPLNSGLYVTGMLVISVFTWLLYRFVKRKDILRQTIVLSFIFMIAGYSSYLMILIRSGENISIDMNNPDNSFSLLHYLNREHYGKRPLFYGHYFNAPVIGIKERSTYLPHEGKYMRYPLNPKYNYDKRFLTIFPRMSDNTDKCAEAYKYWGKIKGEGIQVQNRGKSEVLTKPTFTENLRYFLRYQVGYMYFRYFMWNFVGRQDDVQGLGNILHGNWLSGIGFIDGLRLGPQNVVPGPGEKNKAHNKYYFLPLLFGLIGLIWHYKKNRRDFIAVGLLFFFTGLAITFYLNEVPVTPRERDYVYTASFYAFAIWIGFGVLSVFSFVKKYFPSKPGLIISFTVSLIVPVILLAENWDDHDRSGRFIARDFGYNYINSCRKDAILFTGGDNDTYPLWYIQEVEGVRTDVRVVLQPYLGADWYVNQMRQGINHAGPLPISFSQEKFFGGKRSGIRIVNRINEYVNLTEALDFIKSDNPRTKLMSNDSNNLDYLPANKLKLLVDKNRLIQKGLFSKKELNRIEEAIFINLTKSYLSKSDLILLDIILNNNWERPIYFISPLQVKNLGLTKYLLKEGFVYRLVPFSNQSGSPVYFSQMDVGSTYKKLMNKFKWGNMNNPAIYLDWTSVRQIKIIGIRQTFTQLADSLVKANRVNHAQKVLDKCVEILPLHIIPNDFFNTKIVELYFKIGNKKTGVKLLNEYGKIIIETLNYYSFFKMKHKNDIQEEFKSYMFILNELMEMADHYNYRDFVNKYKYKFEEYYRLLL